MADQSMEELKQKIIEFLKKSGQTKNRDVAAALGVEKRLVDNAIGELSREGVIEYLYLNGSFIKLKDA
ncbi:MAG TPA: winged helix-turn-helix transcriptional regulator [Spirochaetota bacterium]|nr:winged helix-turn-helix transcriptional regulator [Spirochaetota bacterium]HPG50055.1 winged helix-turn-helix transcriptional regulator [Spirochaetota bacterium]HPN11754.1 winged helix-turn-helix transcriptional regulator [Spirochaetota bacterium]HQL82657.1 winged helix-turn-helix transcriptional regulator [Spirochaetota bacterium]